MTLTQHKAIIVGSAIGTMLGFLVFSYFLLSTNTAGFVSLSVFAASVAIASLSLEGNSDTYRHEKNLYRYWAFGMKHVLGRLFWRTNRE